MLFRGLSGCKRYFYGGHFVYVKPLSSTQPWCDSLTTQPVYTVVIAIDSLHLGLQAPESRTKAVLSLSYKII